MHRCHTLRQRQAFTLIEMLVVILIIAILAGLLFPVITGARLKGYIASTKATMTTIEGAIARFKMANSGTLPLDDGTDWTSESGTDKHNDFVVDLATIDRDSFGTSGAKIRGGVIVDAWGSMIRYRPFIAYPEDQPLYDINPDSYHLWSVGPDRNCQTYDGDLDFGDDITNWNSL